MTAISNPVFVRGMSRSGGTLLCTLLDAHAEIAMSYELYPPLLEVDEDVDLASLAKTIANARAFREVSKVAPTKNFGVFVARCERGGLSYQDFARLLLQLIDEGHALTDISGRMRLIELCGLEKMIRQGKSRWGMKCNNSYGDYLACWPQAHFLDIIRDGRDVLASQLTTGNFRNSPKEVAEAWRNTHRKFLELVERGDVNARMVRYERLTNEAEAELREICAFLGLDFDEAMLRHNELDLTVFKARHLSYDRIIKTIDTTMIGRWQRDLTPDQLAQFVEVAGEDLKRHGYM